jgi:LPS sulfotransferase NodH
VYEEFVADPDATVSDILNWLELPSASIKPTRINFQRQSDTTNANWRERYVSESQKYLHRQVPTAEFSNWRDWHFASAFRWFRGR